MICAQKVWEAGGPTDRTTNPSGNEGHLWGHQVLLRATHYSGGLALDEKKSHKCNLHGGLGLSQGNQEHMQLSEKMMTKQEDGRECK